MQTNCLKRAMAVSLVAMGVNAFAQDAGSVDITFNPGTGANNSVYCIAVQTNNQIMVGGMFTTINGVLNNTVARLNSDGSVDSSFFVGQGTSSGSVICIASVADGKTIIAGSFGAVNDLPRGGVARLRVDGSVDTSFIPQTWFATITALAIQPDGKILIGGNVRVLNDLTPRSLLRLNPDGTIDPEFVLGSSTNGNVSSIALQPNGQILIASSSTSVAGLNRTNIARLNSNGTIDGGFTADAINGGVNCVAALRDGKVLIGGGFTDINGYTRQGIARLKADGSLDTMFQREYLAWGAAVYRMIVEADGKVIIYDNEGNGLHRLTTNGNNDASFSVGRGADYEIDAMVEQPDGKLLLGGTFTTFNNTKVNRILRLNSDSSRVSPQLMDPALYMGMMLSGTISNSYRIEYAYDLSTNALWNPISNVTLLTTPQLVVDPTPANLQRRFYRAVPLP